jgi:hypothetical protein
MVKQFNKCITKTTKKWEPICNNNDAKEQEGKDTNFNIINPEHETANQFTYNSFKVCHQNIRGLFGKMEQLLNSLLYDLPHIICLTEHHLNEYEINNIVIVNYVLGANYCRSIHKNGGICIFIHCSIMLKNVPAAKYCVEKDTEACAIKLTLTNFTAIILAVYRSPIR